MTPHLVKPELIIYETKQGSGKDLTDPVRLCLNIGLSDGTLLCSVDSWAFSSYVSREAIGKLIEEQA